MRRIVSSYIWLLVFREVGENSHYWDYPVYCSDGISWTNQLLIGRKMFKNMPHYFVQFCLRKIIEALDVHVSYYVPFFHYLRAEILSCLTSFFY
jgi:hypothetical protein